MSGMRSIRRNCEEFDFASDGQMFFTETPEWADRGGAIVHELLRRLGSEGLTEDRFGMALVVGGRGRQPEGFAHRGLWQTYPGSLVQCFHLVHALAAMEQGRLAGHLELDRALGDMITKSSNSATSYVIDTITGTTGNTLLDAGALANWIDRRERLNRFFNAFNWPEFTDCRITQKPSGDVSYGREAQYACRGNANINVLTPAAVARLMWELFDGRLPLSAAARARAQMTLWRDRDCQESLHQEYQDSLVLGRDLPEDAEIWSKACYNRWTGDPRSSWYKHDLIRIANPRRSPLIVAFMTQGRRIAESRHDVFPQIGRLIWEMTADAGDVA